MTLPEYQNLTQEELELADHYAESGNTAGLRAMQRKSAARGGHSTNNESYHNPIRIKRID